MKLFVWNEPYRVSYGQSILYVVADDLEQARATAKKAMLAAYGSDPRSECTQLPDDLGEPDRILDVPCAEVYEWSE